jgi:hypothetical protein
MWVDPDDDPRNTDGVSPDGELATLLDHRSHYRTLTKLYGGRDADFDGAVGEQDVVDAAYADLCCASASTVVSATDTGQN